jgi:signal transduction histidine kinase/CheY-like chemotaxis protein
MLDHVFSALDMAVLERMENGTLAPAAEPPAWFQQLISPGMGGVAEALPFLSAFLLEAEPFWRSPGRRVDSDTWVETDSKGNEYPLEASAVMVMNRKFVVLRLLGAEYELRKSAVQTARQTCLSYERLGQLTRDLADAKEGLELRNREMERVNRLKSEFLASMSHELRTPLNSIIGFSSLLAEERPGPLNAEQQKFVEHVRRNAHHLLDLINDILDLSRIEAGRLELYLETFTLTDALDEVLATIRPLAEAKAIRLELDCEAGGRVYADRVRFKQMLLNLLSNAIKFTPNNGRVATSARVQGDWLTVAVSDTGMGVPSDEHEAIFEKFHQVGTGTTGVREGSGLGLAITRGLVERHGGRIWVESQPRQGSRFTFTLPFTEKARGSLGGDESAVPDLPSRCDVNDPGVRIAVVEDNPDSRALFRAMLDPPYQVALYEAGSEALEAFEKSGPDLILLDIGLPSMDGIEVLRRIRADKALQSLPVVAVSAHAMAGDRERFLSAGFDAYLAKPIAERAALLGTIEPLLRIPRPVRPL